MDSQTPKPRDPNPSGLGRAIINRKAKDARKMQESGLVRIAYHLWHPLKSVQFVIDVDSTNRLKSVTQERDLDEFLNTAQLAGTEFTAGITKDRDDSYLTDHATKNDEM